MPTISIVIPTYNRRRLARSAVESALGQTWTDLEVIVVDDGSTDGTAEMIQEVQALEWAGKPVRLVVQQNAGAAAARNHGLAVAEGQFVQFLDSDDELHPRKLELQLAALHRPENADAVCCSCYGRLGASLDGPLQSGEYRIGKLQEDARRLLRIMATREVHVMQTSAPLWRRAFLVGRQGWRIGLGAGDDLEYYTRLMSQADKICFVDAELFLVRVHVGDRLSTDAITERMVAATIRTRRAVHASVVAGGVWDKEMQRDFLAVLRILYANALTLGDPRYIEEIEQWIWDLSGQPSSVPAYRALILLRRAFGAKALLRTHALLRQMRVG